MKPKAKQQVEPITTYARGEELAQDQLDAMERAVRDGSAESGDQTITATPAENYDAAVIRPREGVEFLYCGIPRGGEPPTIWHEIGRFDDKIIGAQPYVEARPTRTTLGAPQLAALELAFGRDGLKCYCLDETKVKAHPVQLEGACFVTLQSGSRVLRAKYRGIWLGVCRYTKTEAPPNYPRDHGPGEAYPKIASMV